MTQEAGIGVEISVDMLLLPCNLLPTGRPNVRVERAAR